MLINVFLNILGIQTAKYSLELDDKNSVAHKWYALPIISYCVSTIWTQIIPLCQQGCVQHM